MIFPSFNFLFDFSLNDIKDEEDEIHFNNEYNSVSSIQDSRNQNSRSSLQYDVNDGVHILNENSNFIASDISEHPTSTDTVQKSVIPTLTSFDSELPLNDSLINENEFLDNIPESMQYNVTMPAYPVQVSLMASSIDDPLNQYTFTANISSENFYKNVQMKFMTNSENYTLLNGELDQVITIEEKIPKKYDWDLILGGGFKWCLFVEIWQSDNLIGTDGIWVQIGNLNTPLNISQLPLVESFDSSDSSTNLLDRKESQSTFSLINLRGSFTYYDRYNSPRAIRGAKVELWRRVYIVYPILYYDVLADEGYTRNDGTIIFDTMEEGVFQIKIRADDEMVVRVADAGLLGGQTYGWQTEWHAWSVSDTWNCYVPYSDYYRAAWECYHNIRSEFEWFQQQGVPMSFMNRVSVRWPYGSWPQSDGVQIYMPNVNEWVNSIWEKSVAFHEYAHCVHYQARGGSFPSGSGPSEHYLDSVSSGGFALTEGWAEFIQCAVENNPSIPGSGNLEYTVYADNPFGHGGPLEWDGSIVEGAVAQIFWDFFDGSSSSDYPSFDLSQYGDYIGPSFLTIWNSIKKSSTNLLGNFWSDVPHNVNTWAIFHHARYRCDSTPPSNPSTCYPAPSDTSWFISTFQISLSSVSDDLSGFYGFSYAWDAYPDFSIVQLPINSPTSSGTHYLYLTTCDRAQNWASVICFGPFKIDTENPSVDATYPVPSGIDGWYGSSIQIHLDASDDYSGIQGIYWSVNGAGASSSLSSVTLTLNSEGTNTVNFYTRDKAGRFSATHTLLFKLDLSNPTWHYSVSSAPSNGWYNTPVTITVTGSDSLSGVHYIQWRVGYGSYQTVYSSVASFVISNNGYNHFDFYVVDKVGRSRYYENGVSLDTISPSVPSWYGSSLPLNTWSNINDIRFDWGPSSDTISGVAGYSFSISNGPYDMPDNVANTANTYCIFNNLPDGMWYFHCKAIDNAGNPSTTFHLGPFLIDTHAPDTEEVLPPHDGWNGWYHGSVEVALTRSDLAGIQSTWYQIDGSGFIEYVTPFVVAGDFIHEIQFYSIDILNQKENTKTINVKIDTTNPSIYVIPPHHFEAGSSGNVITCHAWDDNPNYYEFILDGIRVDIGNLYNIPIEFEPTISDPGFYMYYLWVFDLSGNSNTYPLQVYFDDTTPPAFNSLPESEIIESGTTGNTLTWGVFDLYPDYYRITLNGLVYEQEDWSSSTIGVDLDSFGVGQYDFQLTIYDTTGNSMESCIVTVNIVDTTDPIFNLPLPQDKTFEAGTTGNGIIWDAWDLHSSSYHIIQDPDGAANEITSGIWVSGPIEFSLDYLDPGSYVFRIIISDESSNEVFDDVEVVVTDTTSPRFIHTPSDSSYETNTLGNYLNWEVFDLYPQRYRILLDGKEIASIPWSEDLIELNIDNLNPGSHEYVIEFYDQSGNIASDEVCVYVGCITSAGTSVEVVDVITGVSISFSEVFADGVTWVLLTEGPPPPAGFHIIPMKKGGFYCQIITTAQYSGPLLVGVPYNENDVNVKNEDNLELQHWTDDSIDRGIVTTWVDTANDIVYGEVDSLSYFAIVTDVTPPVTSHHIDASVGDNNWYISNVIITLTAVDSALEVALIEYSDGGVTWFDYTGPFTISTNGQHFLYYRSTDTNGNVEVPGEPVEILIDKPTPFPQNPTSFTSSHVVNTWSSIDGFYIEWTGAYDEFSGVYGYSYEWSHEIDTLPDTSVDTMANSITTILDPGIWYLHIRVRDNAGNWAFSAYHIGAFKIDTTPPTPSVHLDGLVGMNGWYVGDVTVNLLEQDGLSGVDYMMYSIDSGPWIVYSDPLIISGDLMHEVEFKAVDYAGNWCAINLVEFVIDTTRPTTDYTVSGETNPEGHYLNSAIVSFTVEDNLEMFSYTEYKINDDLWKRYTGPFVINTEGHFAISFYSLDYAGNIEFTKVIEFDVEGIAFFDDDFVTDSTGYNPTYWTRETTGIASSFWDGNTICGFTASGLGHMTLVSKGIYQPDVRAELNLRMTNNGPWEPVICFGWTDRITTDYNYDFFNGQNGVWLELNWPQQDWFMLYSMKDSQCSGMRIALDFTMFHDYELRWTSNEVVLYIDGEIYGRLTSNIPTIPLRYKMTVTAWSGNTPNEWLYINSVDVGPVQLPSLGKVLAVGDNFGRVHMFLLNGLNIPQSLWTTQLGGTLIQKMLVTDLDQDGDNEVLAASDNGYLYCLDGISGGILWQYSQPWPSFTHWVELYATNIDGDSQLEIITAVNARTSVGGGVIVLEYNGAVRTIHVSPITGGHNGNGPDDIALGDFNGDCIKDIACLYGNVLYSGPQPRIQVIDVSHGAPIVLRDFRSSSLSGAGMTNFVVGDINGDTSLDYIAAGWWCGVAAFENHGSTMWVYNAPGSADKLVQFSENMDGLGNPGAVIGTGAYSNTGGLYIYFVNPASGATYSAIPLGIAASDFRPWTIANLDGDPAMEVIASCNIVGSTSDRMFVMDGRTKQISWYTTLEYSSNNFLAYDLNDDLQSEILAPNGNMISLINGYGATIWNYYLGAIPYVQSAAPVLTEAAPRPPTPVLLDPGNIDDDGIFSLNWVVDTSSGTSIDYYQIQVSERIDFSRILSEWYPNAGELSQTVTLLNPVGYFFRVRAIDLNGFCGDWSNTQDIHVIRDNTVPQINHPSSFSYEENSLGNSIQWNPSDNLPNRYEVYIDGILHQNAEWTGGSLSITVDGLQVGNYSITAVVFDDYDNWISDTTFITVISNEAPVVSDVVTGYEAGTTGNTVTWTPYDYTPDSYEIRIEGLVFESGVWDGLDVTIPIDGLDPGIYVFELTVYDGTGLMTSATATITVLDTTAPTIISDPNDVTIGEGSFGNELVWTASDLYLGYYVLLVDDTEIFQGPWDGTSVIIIIDDPVIGIYNYTLAFFDASGNLASASAWITVVDMTPPSVSGPAEIIYEAGITNNEILWNAYDRHPFRYVISLNDEPILLGLWDGYDVSYDIDGLDPGTYYFTLTCYDFSDLTSLHMVIVIVEDTTPPEITSPDDLVYDAGVMGYSLDWSFSDLYPNSYEILQNGSLIDSGLWTGLDIIISVDLLNPGLYNYTFIAYDLYSNSATNLVWVNVQGNTATGTDIEVPDPETGVSLTFDETTTPGTTSVEISEDGPHPPDDFRLMGLYYNITTTASYDGAIIVAIPYNEALVKGLEKNLKLWHWKEPGGWEDITTWIDEVNNIIYGEVTTLSLFGVMEDNAPPKTKYMLSGTRGLNDWFTSDVSVELIASDSLSEIEVTFYSYDKITWTTYDSSIIILKEGLNTLYFYSIDVAQNEETWNSINIRIDKFAPSTQSYVTLLVSNQYVSSNSFITLEGIDSVSGISATSYRINGGPWITYTTPFNLIGEDGSYLIEFNSTDNAGNSEATVFIHLSLDNTAPISSLVVGVPVFDSYITSDTEINLDALDTDVGLESIYYRISSGAWILYDYPVSIEGLDGQYLFEFYSIDKLGNSEFPNTISFILDNTAPISSHTLIGTSGDNNWFISSVTILLEATDGAGCGVSTILYYLDNGPITEYSEPIVVDIEDGHTIHYWTIDNLGLVEIAENSDSFKIDTYAPTTTHTIDPEYPDGLSDWYVSSVTISLYSTDATSGVFRIYYCINHGSWNIYDTSLVFAIDDYYDLEFKSIDFAGNIESECSISFQIDQKSPISTHSIGEPKYGLDPVYIRTFTPITLSAEDNLAGVSLLEYRIDGGQWIDCIESFYVINSGCHVIDYRCEDNSGNLEDYHTFTVYVNGAILQYIGATHGIYSDPVQLQAQLTDIATQQPINEKLIVFTLGIQSIEAYTNVYGIANTFLILNQPAGTYSVSAAFNSQGTYVSCMDSVTFALDKERAVPEYTGFTIVSTASDVITLRATVFDENDGYFGDITKISVTFRIYTAPIDLTSPIATIGPLLLEESSSSGVGVISIDISNLPENSYIIMIHLDSSENLFYYGPTSELITLTVFEPTGNFVTGGGWIVDSSGQKCHFGFNLKYKKNGLPKGQAIYIYHVDDWEIIIKSNAWIGMAIVENHAFFEGKCTIQKYSSETGELVWAEGNYQIRIDVWDNEETGIPDIFQICVLDKDGITFYEAGIDPLGYLGGGSITIHLDKKED